MRTSHDLLTYNNSIGTYGQLSPEVQSGKYYLRAVSMTLHPTTLAHVPTSDFSHLLCFLVMLFPISITKAKFITCSLPLFSHFINGYVIY